MEPIAPPRTVEVRSYLGRGDERTLADDVLDGLTRPLKELPPKHFYDARGSELFDRSASCPSTTRRAPSARSWSLAREDIVGAHRRRRARRARLGHGREDARAARRDGRGRVAAPLRPARRHRGDGARRRRGARRASTRACDVHGVVGDFERHLDRTSRRPAARASSRSSAGRSATSRPAAGGASCAASRDCSARTDHLLLGTDLVKDPRITRGRLRRQRRASPRSSTSTSCTCSTASSTPTSTSTRSSTSRSTTASTSGSRCACAPGVQHVHVGALGPRPATSPRARSCARRSARSSRASAAGDLAPPAWAGRALHRPDGLFAVSLSRRA